MRLIPMLLAVVLLPACGTMQIGERNFIRADKPGAKALPRADFAALSPAGSVSEETIASTDGAVLKGVLWRQPGARQVVLYFGGNQFHLDQHGAEVLPLIASCGTDVALFDYRGYGRSSGAPTVANMKQDAVRVFDHLNGLYPGGVIVHGQSLGSLMTGYVVQQRPAARAMVLESTTTNVPDWVDANVPWYARLVTKVEVDAPLRAVDNTVAVREYRNPSLVLAGGRDRITPVALARKVFDAIPAPAKQWYEAPDAGHNDVFGTTKVMQLYCSFIKSQS